MRKAISPLIVLSILGSSVNAGVLTADLSHENAVVLVPGAVPDPPGVFGAGTYGLMTNEPFSLNLTAAPSGSVGSYIVLISFLNLTPEAIGQVDLGVEGPAQIGDAFALEWGPVYGPADSSSSTAAQFILDTPWDSSLSASTLFELEVLDPTDTPNVAITVQTLPVPEPGSIALMGIGLAFIGRRTTRAHRRR